MNSAGYIAKFKLPPDETLAYDCSCALSKSILLQGRMYVSAGYVCFYSKIFGFETKEAVRMAEIASVTKRTKFVLGIEILTTKGQRYLFTSFLSRERAYSVLRAAWEKATGKIADSGARPDSPTGGAPAPATTAPATAAIPITTVISSSASSSSLPAGKARTAAAAAAAAVLDSGLDLLLQETGEDLKGFLNTAQVVETLRGSIPNITPPQFFHMFFGDESEFDAQSHIHNKDANVHTGKWQMHEQFGRVREEDFMVQMKGAPMGPPMVNAHVTSRYFLSRKKLIVE
jgi:hypothetical protein